MIKNPFFILSEIPKKQCSLGTCKCGNSELSASDQAFYLSIWCECCGEIRTLDKRDILTDEGKKTWYAIGFCQEVEQICGDYLIVEWAKHSDELGLGLYKTHIRNLANIKNAEQKANR